MILLKAQMTIKAEGRPVFLEVMQHFMQASRVEAGCLSFDCYEDTAQPNYFIVLETWDDEASLKQHEHSEHLAQFKAVIGGMIVSRETTLIYTVNQVNPLR
jgi:quinol monooxygenase YgiN